MRYPKHIFIGSGVAAGLGFLKYTLGWTNFGFYDKVDQSQTNHVELTTTVPTATTTMTTTTIRPK